MWSRVIKGMIVLGLLSSSACSTEIPTLSGELYTDQNLLPNISSSEPDIAISPTSTPRTELACSIHLTAQWGDGLGELGFCAPSSEAWVRGPYAPRLDAQGGLFIVDKANRRVSHYEASMLPHIIPFPTQHMTDDTCSYQYRLPNLSVSRNRLFLLFSIWQEARLIDQLIVLSLDGQVERTLGLEPYYPLRSPYMDTLISDRKGGVYLLLPPAGVVYFDPDLRPEFMYLGTGDSSIYEGLHVGWDDNLYTYSADRDMLVNWGIDNQQFRMEQSIKRMEGIIANTSVVSPTYSRLVGVDDQGRLYFGTYEQSSDTWVLIRLSAVGEELEIATVPKGYLNRDGLAPDGSLYSLVYDLLDTSVNPHVVKCAFSSD